MVSAWPGMRLFDLVAFLVQVRLQRPNTRPHTEPRDAYVAAQLSMKSTINMSYWHQDMPKCMPCNDVLSPN